ncbi:MAG: IS91 family transposase [Bdellovibrionales bacterium]|nr:IS91 family transposase [Bdellovibrionales bacterium]
MSSFPLEVSEIFRQISPSYYASLSVDKKRVVDAILRCRTSALGAHISKCDRCGHKEQSYNSCRNRHCPKCQGSRSAKWTEARAKDLLPVPYFHTVFTVPQELREIAYRHKREFYELMFQAVSETMKAVAKNEKFLGAKISFYTVLHTWNQKLEFHPHIHVVSPNGGLSEDGSAWITKHENFFLPVRALSQVYRGKLVEALRAAFSLGKLPYIPSRIELEKVIGRCHVPDWVVYSKRPFEGPEQVIKYLSSYIHRVAISNRRLRTFDGERVAFAYRDPERKEKKKVMSLSKESFTRRFLLHIIPKNFTRIRHYGFLASPIKEKNLALAKELIGKVAQQVDEATSRIREICQSCPECKEGTMHGIYTALPMIVHRGSAKPSRNSLSHSPP